MDPAPVILTTISSSHRMRDISPPSLCVVRRLSGFGPVLTKGKEWERGLPLLLWYQVFPDDRKRRGKRARFRAFSTPTCGKEHQK